MSTSAAVVVTAEERFRHHFGEMRTLGRRAVEAAWRAGAALVDVQREAERGQFGTWLEAEGVAKSTAYRLMELARAYETSQIGKFETVDAALTAAKDRPAPTAASIQNRGKAAGQRASAKAMQRQEERTQLQAAKEGEDILAEELDETRAVVVALKAQAGEADPDDAAAEWEALHEKDKATIQALRKDLAAERKRRQEAEADRDHWKSYAATVEQGLQHVNG